MKKRRMKKFTLTPIRGLPTHTFNGKVYEIALAVGRHADNNRGDGYCEPRRCKQPLLWVHHDIRDNHMRLVEVLVHEGLHACLWELPEREVARVATDISRFVARYLLATSDAARKSLGLKPLAEMKDDEIAPERPERRSKERKRPAHTVAVKDCIKCGGSRFSGHGKSYDDLCDACGGIGKELVNDND